MRTVMAVTLALCVAYMTSGLCQALLQQPTVRVATRCPTRPCASTNSGTYSSQRPGIRMAAARTDDAAVGTNVLAGCKLTYFGIPGRGEAIRLALAIGGVDFEDNRVPFPAWNKVKPTTPWGTLPVLELADGSQLAQARSILRFVGKHTGLYPSDPLVAQRVDELMDALEDLSATITNTGQGLEKEEQEIARLFAVSEGGAVYDVLTKIDAFIQANGANGYAVGAEINIASILTFTNIGRLVGGVYNGVPSTVCDPFLNIQLVRKTVGIDGSVVAWYDARIDQQKSLEKLSPAEQILVGCRDM